MTSYGRAQASGRHYRVTVEIRTLNGRYLDIVVRIPKNYLELEDFTRKYVSRRIKRGRVEVFIQIEPLLIEAKAPRINIPLARYYWKQLRDLQAALPALDPPRLSDLLKLPNLFETDNTSDDLELLRETLDRALREAMDTVMSMRRTEGLSLSDDFKKRITHLRSELDAIKEQKPLMLEAYQERLHSRIQELLGSMGQIELDSNRLFQEVALFAERSDITEETVRTESHLQQMERLLESQQVVEGRQLDFLTQELQREINTIGAKANDLQIARIVVGMKAEIGKLREQVQNIE